jgi:hypothetical protein
VPLAYVVVAVGLMFLRRAGNRPPDRANLDFESAVTAGYARFRHRCHSMAGMVQSWFFAFTRGQPLDMSGRPLGRNNAAGECLQRFQIP